jgi:hypothetical protein
LFAAGMPHRKSSKLWLREHGAPQIDAMKM